MIPWIHPSDAFPSIEAISASREDLICAGADLSPERLLDAYQRGLFPWFSPGDPLLWWSPDPRMVLYLNEFKCSRSLRQILRRGNFETRFDHDFPAVIEACATQVRKGQNGTWITREMREAYTRFFRQGFAHSVEVWMDGELAGGLYGVAIGKMFYGESMFSRVSNASKIALACLVRFLSAHSFGLIDCQMNTPHLASLGAREISRAAFIETLRRLTALPPRVARWPKDAGVHVREAEPQ